MRTADSIELTRDCPATQIPSGVAVTLPARTLVQLTQSLGGTFTVQTDMGLFRIGGQDADALGISQVSNGSNPAAPDTEKGGPVKEELVWDILRTCYDPEIPVNIVDLGLVYDLRIEPIPSGKSKVTVKMTLTAPGCGMGATIAGEAQQRLLELPGVGEADVDIVWEPPWHHSMISPVGRTTLGLD